MNYFRNFCISSLKLVNKFEKEFDSVTQQSNNCTDQLENDSNF